VSVSRNKNFGSICLLKHLLPLVSTAHTFIFKSLSSFSFLSFPSLIRLSGDFVHEVTSTALSLLTRV
jgi:hypothetical protein